MNSTTYVLRPLDRLLVHDVERNERFVRDITDDPEQLEIMAFAASGDCFAMLASILDQISCNMPCTSPAQPQIQQTIHILLYLHDHYKITKKYRQW